MQPQILTVKLTLTRPGVWRGAYVDEVNNLCFSLDLKVESPVMLHTSLAEELITCEGVVLQRVISITWNQFPFAGIGSMEDNLELQVQVRPYSDRERFEYMRGEVVDDTTPVTHPSVVTHYPGPGVALHLPLPVARGSWECVVFDSQDTLVEALEKFVRWSWDPRSPVKSADHAIEHLHGLIRGFGVLNRPPLQERATDLVKDLVERMKPVRVLPLDDLFALVHSALYAASLDTAVRYEMRPLGASDARRRALAAIVASRVCTVAAREPLAGAVFRERVADTVFDVLTEHGK